MNSVGDLYKRNFDMAPVKSRTRYILAATPRSGSTLFASLLWQTGVLGAPLEYLNLENSLGAIFELGHGSVERYWSEIQTRRRSSNGVFGVKMFPKYFERIRRSSPEIFADLLTINRIILLKRRDRIGQAISLAKALQTNAWASSTSGQAEPFYDRDRIIWAMAQIDAEMDRWNAILASMDVIPLEIDYDELVADRDSAVLAACSYLGVEPDPSKALDLDVDLAMQRNRESADWRARFES